MPLSGDVTAVQKRLQNNITTAITTTVEALNFRFGSLIDDSCEEFSAVDGFKIFQHDAWPENSTELADYGNAQLEALMEHFGHVLNRHVDV